MTVPRAYYSHEIPGRLRLRIPSKRQDQEYFSRVEKVMQKMKNVDHVQVQPLTGSVLILHHGKSSELHHSLNDTSRKNHLFRLQSGHRAKASGNYSWADQMFHYLDEWDRGISRATDGVWDLASLSAVGIAAVGVYQVSQKELLPPAWALFGNAFEVLATNRWRKRRSRKNHDFSSVLRARTLEGQA